MTREEKAHDNLVHQVAMLRNALADIQERADRGGRRLETAMEACDDIELIAKTALELYAQ